MLDQIKSCLRYGGARVLYVLNTNTALLNITFCSGGSSPKYRSFVTVVKEKRKKNVKYHYSRPGQLMHRLGDREGKYEHGKTACA